MVNWLLIFCNVYSDIGKADDFINSFSCPNPSAEVTQPFWNWSFAGLISFHTVNRILEVLRYCDN